MEVLTLSLHMPYFSINRMMLSKPCLVFIFLKKSYECKFDRVLAYNNKLDLVRTENTHGKQVVCFSEILFMKHRNLYIRVLEDTGWTCGGS
jgi:hypothetical protein